MPYIDGAGAGRPGISNDAWDILFPLAKAGYFREYHTAIFEIRLNSRERERENVMHMLWYATFPICTVHTIVLGDMNERGAWKL